MPLLFATAGYYQPLMDNLAGFCYRRNVVVDSLGIGGGEPATPGQLMSFMTLC
jgi:hypothetical protein